MCWNAFCPAAPAPSVCDNEAEREEVGQRSPDEHTVDTQEHFSITTPDLLQKHPERPQPRVCGHLSGLVACGSLDGWRPGLNLPEEERRGEERAGRTEKVYKTTHPYREKPCISTNPTSWKNPRLLLSSSTPVSSQVPETPGPGHICPPPFSQRRHLSGPAPAGPGETLGSRLASELRRWAHAPLTPPLRPPPPLGSSTHTTVRREKQRWGKSSGRVDEANDVFRRKRC
ncbi:uncharacterized protein LOC129411597 [Boleophthalmus pectinirostris]|uniref:uncharacterized protein LOC129411597 n=1 Tax=Boleophthalmus pectinirostris TaxID=150288 RepID=UPI00242EDA21|nr:uncharacterized protein LOC129411597 [Boleophthalmus pectinirostris]